MLSRFIYTFMLLCAAISPLLQAADVDAAFIKFRDGGFFPETAELVNALIGHSEVKNGSRIELGYAVELL